MQIFEVKSENGEVKGERLEVKGERLEAGIKPSGTHMPLGLGLICGIAI